MTVLGYSLTSQKIVVFRFTAVRTPGLSFVYVFLLRRTVKKERLQNTGIRALMTFLLRSALAITVILLQAATVKQ